MTDWMRPKRPYAIAHRGASAYAADNTLRAFEVASDLGAAFWEVDIRRTADGVLVAHHDPALPDGHAIAALTAEDLAEATRAAGRPAPTLEAVLQLAVARGAGIYADIKDSAAAPEVARCLQAYGIEKAILGAFDPAAVAALADAPYPRAALVPLGADPFEHAKGADIIHLCWERMERPQDVLTPEYFARAEAQGQATVLWHEEDPARMAELRVKPVLGICSDTPELVHPFAAPAGWPVRTVAHRGANSVAPENTLPAAACAFNAGFDVVELDLHTSADGELVVIHDYELDRTTDGKGLVATRSWADLAKADAGGWFDAHFTGIRLPRLADMLRLARSYGKGIYIEIKEADPLHALRVVEAEDMLAHVFFWSWRYAYLRAIKRANPAARVMTRRMDFASLEDCVADLAPDLIEYDSSESWDDMDQARAMGLPVMICYMGRDPKVFDRVIAARPDIVNIDDIFIFRDRLKRMAAQALFC